MKTRGIFLCAVLALVVNVAQAEDQQLICKTKKSRLQFDWKAASVGEGTDQLDQNMVRYDFRAANKPAGERGENLKVGECGWAARALGASKSDRSQFTYHSLSDEVNQDFYKLRTGKVFKLPVRQTKNGLVVVPGSDLHVIR